MNKRYTKEEKRAILAIVDACMVFSVVEDDCEWFHYPWISTILNRATGRDLLWPSWVRHVRRWREELEPVPYVPTKKIVSKMTTEQMVAEANLAMKTYDMSRCTKITFDFE
jgi:hypothetical protein